MRSARSSGNQFQTALYFAFSGVSVYEIEFENGQESRVCRRVQPYF
ncbi:hypothetical protein NEICINOT_04194 [Neisseria cinerea ATCC 14685]|uniref:Uncharacterized protein n=1 Tax=Neisseria cinerea ATCC 14685 TaxID=546262 RepID=D0W3F6_NEICI|nr:hypothetical protein NEICINOT_04194 [Neisseria cinerea ATCC 14685]